jgi:hypothetical protein
MFTLYTLGTPVLEALRITRLDGATRCAPGIVNRAIERPFWRAEVLAASVRLGSKSLGVEVPLDQAAQNVVAFLAPPANQILGADEHAPIGRIATASAAASAVELRGFGGGIHRTVANHDCGSLATASAAAHVRF